MAYKILLIFLITFLSTSIAKAESSDLYVDRLYQWLSNPQESTIQKEVLENLPVGPQDKEVEDFHLCCVTAIQTCLVLSKTAVVLSWLNLLHCKLKVDYQSLQN